MVYSRQIGTRIVKTILVPSKSGYYKEVDIIEFDAHIEDSSQHDDVKHVPHTAQVGSHRKIAA
jgi:hypothetical protein